MNSRTGWLLLLISLVLVVPANSEGTPKSVFIHAACNGRMSAAVLSSLRDRISGTKEYLLVRTLNDEGRMGIVLTIYMSCAEHNDVVGIATSYGVAKCYGEKNCHLSVDGLSIKSTLCDLDAGECGRMLFGAFDEYLKHTPPVALKLN
jgi:hypothetical protein